MANKFGKLKSKLVHGGNHYDAWQWIKFDDKSDFWAHIVKLGFFDKDITEYREGEVQVASSTIIDVPPVELGKKDPKPIEYIDTTKQETKEKKGE